MRWYWIDRFVEFESGRYAKAVKNISLAEDYLHDHFPGYPVIPRSLVIEGLAQTGGLLVSEHSNYTEKVILAKITKARFFCEAVPGDTLTYTASLDDVSERGARVKAQSYKGEQLQAEMEVMFVHFNGEHQGATAMAPAIFLDMMRLLGAFEVGHAADGSRLVQPAPPAKTPETAERSGPARPR